MSWPVHLRLAGSTLHPRLKEVTVEIVGPLVPLAEACGPSWRGAWWQFERSPDVPDAAMFPGAIKIRKLTVFGASTVLYGEIRWRQNGKRKESIRGLERGYNPQDLVRVSQWLRAVLKRLPRAGKHLGSGRQYPDWESLERDIFAAMARLRRRGDTITQDRVEQLLPVRISATSDGRSFGAGCGILVGSGRS